ncbi:MAG: UvrD-helicase domain-containing protein [Pseudomonadota bacterium]|nr:UvrD-helicase domain-containing protein [Pseudomonadota bacterium]
MNDMVLNANQQEAVHFKDGQAVVFASAGSGKTRIITARIAKLIDDGVPPHRILAVTFTNRAAREMRERLEVLAPSAKRALVATFHAACVRFLREFAPEVGLSVNFAIYDQKDSIGALKTVLNNAHITTEDDSDLAQYHAAIAKAKINCIFAHDQDKILQHLPKLIAKGGFNIYQAYQRYLKTCDAADFGDLILHTIFLLRNNENVCKTLQQRFSYILIDEYQDINNSQFELVNRLAAQHRNLFVVGDDDQSIYGWRGANPQNILQFNQLYPRAKKIILNQNYRNSGTIVAAAGAIIAKNTMRVPKEMWTDENAGHPIEFKHLADAEIEAYEIVDAIKQEQDQFPYRNVAILYRTNSQSRQIEDILHRQQVSYQIHGALRFYDRAEIKDILAYFRLAMNENDNVSFKRIINVPTRGIGSQTVATIERQAFQEQHAMLKQARIMMELGTPKIANKLKPFFVCFDRLQAELSACELSEAVEVFLRHVDYFAYVQKKYKDNADEKRDNISELDGALKDYASKQSEPSYLLDWLQTVSLLDDESTQDRECVSLLTLHAVKGLEFDRVFIAGVEEGLIPHRNCVDSRDQLEEERRLLYVGMTRARKKLTLTSALRRRSFSGWSSNRPSRFLADIPSRYLQLEQSEQVERQYTSPVSNIRIGMRIHHPTYGAGRVKSIERRFGKLALMVAFDEFGLQLVNPSHLHL